MTFVAQALARRAGLRGEIATDELLSASEQRVMTLLRMAGVRRELGGRIARRASAICSASTDPGGAIAAFDAHERCRGRRRAQLAGADPAYRRAVGGLDSG